MRRRAFRSAAGVAIVLCFGARPALSHVGSPDTWFEGQAGPYPVRVVVRAPGVVPGLAQIDVRVQEGGVRQVTVQPYVWDGGSGGAPPPDVAKPVPGDPKLYTVQLWFMAPSSYGVHVQVEGDRGRGTAIVPVQAVATRRLELQGALRWALIGLGLFLAALGLSAVRAAVRESVLPPGHEPDAHRKRRALVATLASGAFLALLLWGGRTWWNSVDRAYQSGLYKPFRASASVESRGGASLLHFDITDPAWLGRRWTPLIPDHGKLMHLFLIREPDLDAFAHLHPVPRDSSHFEVPLPPLPGGRYRVYADIVHESGFAQTLTTTLEMPSGASHAGTVASADPDDAWWIASPVEATDRDAAEPRTTFEDGATLTWERGAKPPVPGADAGLRFVVREPDGRIADLEPYLGMRGHAIVTRDDGSVFVHLHPIGTVPMASQMALTSRAPGDTVPGTLGKRLTEAQEMGGHAAHLGMAMASEASAEEAAATGAVSFPYGFPAPGRYHIWVQVKLHDKVRTASFSTRVNSAGPS